jgi:hypothetical protein
VLPVRQPEKKGAPSCHLALFSGLWPSIYTHNDMLASLPFLIPRFTPVGYTDYLEKNTKYLDMILYDFSTFVNMSQILQLFVGQ